VKKEQNGRGSLRRLKRIVGCNASKRRKRICYVNLSVTSCWMIKNCTVLVQARNIFYGPTTLSGAEPSSLSTLHDHTQTHHTL
jgi:hypothetical protein